MGVIKHAFCAVSVVQLAVAALLPQHVRSADAHVRVLHTDSTGYDSLSLLHGLMGISTQSLKDASLVFWIFQSLQTMSSVTAEMEPECAEKPFIVRVDVAGLSAIDVGSVQRPNTSFTIGDDLLDTIGATPGISRMLAEMESSSGDNTLTSADGESLGPSSNVSEILDVILTVGNAAISKTHEIRNSGVVDLPRNARLVDTLVAIGGYAFGDDEISAGIRPLVRERLNSTDSTYGDDSSEKYTFRTPQKRRSAKRSVNAEVLREILPSHPPPTEFLAKNATRVTANPLSSSQVVDQALELMLDRTANSTIMDEGTESVTAAESIIDGDSEEFQGMEFPSPTPHSSTAPPSPAPIEPEAQSRQRVASLALMKSLTDFLAVNTEESYRSVNQADAHTTPSHTMPTTPVEGIGYSQAVPDPDTAPPELSSGLHSYSVVLADALQENETPRATRTSTAASISPATVSSTYDQLPLSGSSSDLLAPLDVFPAESSFTLETICQTRGDGHCVRGCVDIMTHFYTCLDNHPEGELYAGYIQLKQRFKEVCPKDIQEVMG